MKLLVCVAVVLGVAWGAREKRGIFGEPGGLLSGAHLHHDSALSTHAHLHASAPVLHAPLRTSLLSAAPAHILHAAPSPVLHAAPLRTSLLHAAPVLHAPLRSSIVHQPLHAHIPLSSGLHHHDISDHHLLHEAAHHAPLYAPSPVLYNHHHHHDIALPHYHSAPAIISRPSSW